ncbi:MAG: gephyrin-like molybdotransferase Glp [Acidimicrobiales bacterium]
MIDVADAKRFVLDGLAALAPVELSLVDALGCVAVDEIRALEPVPGFANSSMDGFALRSVDSTPDGATLVIAGSLLAGDAPSARVEPGQAVRIMTGAPLPDGGDCVCMIEQAVVDMNAGTVEIARSLVAGENVRYPGEDVKVGQILVVPGDELDAIRLGVLAGQGFASVRATPRPRVAVVSTGNELVSSTEALRHGEIRDTNRPTLLALLRESGFTPIDVGTVRDEYDVIRSTFEQVVGECDALVSTGGVSVGDVDHVKGVIGELGGASATSMQVAVRPGKPFAFGRVGPRGVPVFGLPGNPVSTRVSFELFVRPALRVLGGHRDRERLAVVAVLDCAIPRTRDGKLHMVHAWARFRDDGRVHIESIVRPGSHLISAVAGANALVMAPDGDGLAPGVEVRALILDATQLGAEVRDVRVGD